MRFSTLTLITTALVVACLPAAAEVTLSDWCVNLNGDITTACNFAGSGGPNINLSLFDATVGSANNTLGSIKVNIGTGNIFAAVYMDYDVDAQNTASPCPPTGCGSFDDLGSTHGIASATQSWVLGDPNVFSGSSSPTGEVIFDQFANVNSLTPLPNTNGVGNTTACGAGAASFCDVAWSLAEQLFVDPALYSGGTITFTVGTTAPSSGFYLQQTNQVSGTSIYLSDSISLTPNSTTPPPVPEPGSAILLGTVVTGLLVAYRRYCPLRTRI